MGVSRLSRRSGGSRSTAWRVGVRPTPVAPASLLAHSTSISGMWLPHAFTVPGLMPHVMDELFGAVADGSLRVVPGGEYRALGRAAGSRGSARPSHDRQDRPRSVPLTRLRERDASLKPSAR